MVIDNYSKIKWECDIILRNKIYRKYIMNYWWKLFIMRMWYNNIGLGKKKIGKELLFIYLFIFSGFR